MAFTVRYRERGLFGAMIHETTPFAERWEAENRAIAVRLSGRAKVGSVEVLPRQSDADGVAEIEAADTFYSTAT